MKFKGHVVFPLIIGGLLLGNVSDAATKPYKVAFIIKTLTNPFFITMADGVKAAAKELGAKVVDVKLVSAERETSSDQQIQLVEDMITQKVDAIAIAPIDSKAIVPSLLKAQKAGITVINIDNRVDQQAAKDAGLKLLTFVSADNEAGSYMGGKYLAKLMAGAGKVAMLEGIPGVDNGEARKRGFLKAMKENPSIKIVASQTARWETEQALNVMSDILQANPDLNGVFAANDNMALGAIQAIDAAGKTGKIFVVGYDNLAAAQDAIKAGRMNATIEQNPYLMGYYGIKLAVNHLDGKFVKNPYMVPLKLIDKSTLK